MTERKRITWLIIIMMAAVSVSTAVAITVLYKTAFQQERSHLIQIVDDQAHLMDAVAQFDRQYHGDAPEAATVSQIQSAFDHYPSYGQTTEIAVAQLKEDEIVYLVTHGKVVIPRVQPIPIASKLAEPMRRALSGHSGSMIGLDYRGVEVLAAYAPVPILKAGVVAKMDLADIRAPFVRGAAMVIGLALLLVSLGTLLFVRLTTPMVKHLVETEHRYQRLFNGAPVPIWDQDFSRVNEALQDLKRSGVKHLGSYFGDNPEALRLLLGKVQVKEANAAALKLFAARSETQFSEWFHRVFVPAATLETSADELQALWEGNGALVDRTVSVRTLDGRDLTVLLSMVVPVAAEGYRSMPASALDVTAEMSLRRREEELDLILSSTGEGVFGLDNQGKCIFINRAAALSLGYRETEDLLGREIHGLIHRICTDDSGSTEECPLRRAGHENRILRFDDEKLDRRDGTRFSAEYRSYPMVREGAMVGTVVIFTDITERKEREAQHLHTQKMEVVGQLTGGIAHDFNNLLAIILVNLRMLSKQIAEGADGTTRELLEDTLSAAEDGAELTDRLLAFSRRKVREPRLSDVNGLLDDYQKFLHSVTGDDIALVLCRAEGRLLAVVDPQQLANAVLNLAINARDAMPDGGTLTIQAARRRLHREMPVSQGRLPSGSYVVVSVADTGEGMAPETVQRAVEPFFTTKPPGKGSGLGLSTVFRFAHQAGGGVGIESARGRGTVVSIYLPESKSAAEDRVPGPPRGEPRPVQRKAARVLLVEDDERTRRLTRRTLSEFGYGVLEAENAAGAIQILEHDPDVDLLFTDIAMPGELDGRELGHWARRHNPGLKVLLTSGLPQRPPGEREPGKEALPFIKKPYVGEQLDETIQALLRSQAY